MEVRLSGGVGATVDGAAVHLGAAKGQVLLAALALEAGSTVGVGRLVQLVWDEPPRTAEKTLQTYVAQLRKVLGADSIERIGDGYRLALEPDAIDLVRFERLVAEDRNEEAAQLWRGPPLAGLAAPGLEPAVARLVEMYLAVVEANVESQLGRGEAAAAVACLRELVSEHPLREGLWALLMRALYQSGRQGDALRAYSEAREVLVEELGIEPGPRLRDLERRVLEQDQTLESPALPDQATAVGSSATVRTFLFTDIQNSTALWSTHPDEMSAAAAEHDKMIEQAVHMNGGIVAKHMGDGVIAVFGEPTPAVRAAVAAQLDIQSLTVGNEALNVRMAVASGRAEPRDNDWFGPALNLAARLLDAAHGGQIVLAGATADALTNDIDAAVATSDLGLTSLRGLARPERVHQVMHPSLPRRFGPLRTQRPEPQSEEAEFPSQLVYPNAIPFVGRAEHLTAIEEAWARVRRERRPSFVLLGGEPGVGKTRLAATAAQSMCDVAGATVVYGRCVEGHASPFRPFTEALNSYGRARSDTELRTEMGIRPEYLTPVVPLLLDRFPDIEQVSLVDESGQLAVFDAVSEFMSIAATSPLVLVLDDLHWADNSTIDLMRHLAQNTTTGQLMVLATYRDVEVERSHPLSRLLADLRRESAVLRLAVRGIDADESAALVEAILGHELSTPGRELAVRAGEDASGNPFFLQEMLHHFMESGLLVKRQGRWTAVDADTLVDAVPEGIREVVGRRLDNVGEACNGLLRTASALGDDIDVRLLANVHGGDEDEVLDLLDEALERGLLVDADRVGRYEFSHGLVRQTLYREFSTARRLRLHDRIARALIEGGRGDDATVDSIATHLLAAATVAEPSEVVRWTREAARRANDRFSFSEAATHLARALEVTDGQLGADDLVALMADLAAAEMRCLDFDSAAAHLESLTTAMGQARPDIVAHAAIVLGRAVLSRSAIGGLGSLIESVLIESRRRPAEDDALNLAVEVGSADLGLVSVGLLDWIDRFDEMDDATLSRAIIVPLMRSVPSKKDADRYVEVVTDVASRRRSISATEAARTASRGFAELSWGPLDIEESSEQHPMAGRMHGMRVLRPVPIAIHHADFAEARRHIDGWGLPPALSTYARRRIAFESDELDAGGDRPDADHTQLRVAGPRAFLASRTMRRSSTLEKDDVRRIASEAKGLVELGAAVEFAHELGLADLAEDLWSRLEPARGLRGPMLGVSLVSAVDYQLGLLAELLGNLDEAIELHTEALTRTRDSGVLLDVGYITEQLVLLLRRRNGPGDAERADAVAAETLAALEPTEAARCKRLVAEALRTPLG